MLRNSKLSNYSVKKIYQCFCIDIPASKAASSLDKFTPFKEPAGDKVIVAEAAPLKHKLRP